MVEVKGLKELLRTLESLPPEIGSKGGGPLRRALFLAADGWRESAERLAPVGVDPDPRGRRLKDHIVTIRDKDPQSSGFAEQYSVTYSTRTFWGGFVEAGTSKQSAQPFLRPVADSEQDAAINTFADELRKGLDRAVKRAKR